MLARLELFKIIKYLLWRLKCAIKISYGIYYDFNVLLKKKGFLLTFKSIYLGLNRNIWPVCKHENKTNFNIDANFLSPSEINDFIWNIMHHKCMRDRIISITNISNVDVSHYNEEEVIPRLIKMYSGEYISLISEGFNIKGVINNCKDSIDREIKNTKELSLYGCRVLPKLYELKGSLKKRNKMYSYQLRDTNSMDLAFQATGLLLGLIYGYSLWNGSIITSKHSFVVQVDSAQQPYIFVHFDDIEPWYLMVGSYRGSKNYIYLPSRNLVIMLNSPDHDWYEISNYISCFKRYAMSYPLGFNDYLSSDTKPAVYSGGIKNLGHFLWNEVQGIFNAKNGGFLNYDTEYILYKNQYLKLDELFYEVVNSSVTDINDGYDAFVKIIDQKLFCIHPTAFRMTSDCASTIRSFAYNSADVSVQNSICEAKKTGITFWFNLRSHNKVWLEQVSGVSLICEYLKGKYEKVTLVLDGLVDCEELVDEVVNEVDGITIIDCTNTSLVNSIAWASSVDFFVSTIGSGLTLNTWIGEKRGVAHAEKTHLKQMDMWSEVRSDIPAPLFPHESLIIEQTGNAYGNYSIDPDAILRLVKKIA